MNKQQDFLHGPIIKQLLFFFFPILLGTLFQQLYNTVDTIIVGQYVGTSALAAIGSTSNLVNLIIYFFVGLSTGAGVIISQYYGAKDENRISLAVHTAVAISLVSGLVMMLFGLFFSQPCLQAIGVPLDILKDSALYMQLYFLGMIPGTIYNVGAAILRAVGDSKRPLYYLVICSIVNVVFDYIFVVYFHWGIAGAASATVIAQLICSILVSMRLIRTNEMYKISIRKIRFDLVILMKIVKIGIPAGLQSTMYSVSNIVLQTHINAFGTNTIASWAVYTKVDALFWLVMGAIGAAVTTFAGQNFGAKQYDRIQKGAHAGLAIAILFAALISGLLYLFGQPICSLFSNDLKMLKECNEIIRFLTPLYFTYCCVEIFSGIMRGCGQSLKPMLLVCIGICVLRIVWVTFVSPLHYSFNMVIISYPVTWATTSLLFILYYQLFKKKHICL